ncbi:phosphatase PAP2 family protein [Pseudomonadales bacterium]|nr:phosphatase PAP2 family protein [Pseudomonadales bacterium]
MNPFDISIIQFFNQFVQTSWAIDKTVIAISINHLLKGAMLITPYWWLWFREENQEHNRRGIISILMSCFVAMFLARGLALTLPMRLRPIHTEGIGFNMPIGLDRSELEGWSAFPSDHAVLFFALAIGIYFMSKRIGIIALIYTFLMIALPRIYLGLHWPTDILVGAMLGILICYIGFREFPKFKPVKWITDLSYAKPEFFYPAFFLLCYQFADMFSTGRLLGLQAFKLAEFIFL